jgi:hypothetical protein
MHEKPPTHEEPPTELLLLTENAELRTRLEGAEETLRAIHNGEVDAFVIESAAGPRVYTLQGVDAASNRLRGDILAQVSDAVIAIDGDSAGVGVEEEDTVLRRFKDPTVADFRNAHFVLGLLAAGDVPDDSEHTGRLVDGLPKYRDARLDVQLAADRPWLQGGAIGFHRPSIGAARAPRTHRCRIGVRRPRWHT